MANLNFSISLFVLIILLVQNHAKSAFVTRNLDPKLLSLTKETLSRFKFYGHVSTRAGNATVLTIVTPPVNYTKPGSGPINPTDGSFGTMNAIDIPLTEKPELNSTLVGRVQGFYVQASQKETALVMLTNFAFLHGDWNGSSLSVAGRNLAYEKARELPVIGGTGRLRFARGYVRISTYSVNPALQSVTLEYNAYVTHYVK